MPSERFPRPVSFFVRGRRKHDHRIAGLFCALHLVTELWVATRYFEISRGQVTAILSGTGRSTTTIRHYFDTGQVSYKSAITISRIRCLAVWIHHTPKSASAPGTRSAENVSELTPGPFTSLRQSFHKQDNDDSPHLPSNVL